MTTGRTEELLAQALLQNGEMDQVLYEQALEVLLDELIDSMQEDEDDYTFAVIEKGGSVAMMLAEKSGTVHANEDARERLKALWPAAYEDNIRMMIPDFAAQLDDGDIPICGVTTVE